MHRTLHGFVVCLLLAAASVAAAQDALAPIRALYASAEYEEALSAIGRMTPEAGAAAIEVGRYRVLCLVALDRVDDARRAIEDIVSADPFFVPAPSDASPRVRALYSEVRRQALPAVGRELYAEAKAAFDRKAFAEATEKFNETLRVLDDPDTAADHSLADLRVLVDGFLELTAASTPAAPTPAAPAETPDTETSPAPAEPALSGPVVVKQELPPWEGLSRAGTHTGLEFRGSVEVEIDEQGNVAEVRLLEAVHPLYDARLLEAARTWKYQPARRAGEPIRVRKRVDVVLRDP